MSNRMKLGTRMAMGFGFLIAISGVLGCAGWSGLSNAATNAELNRQGNECLQGLNQCASLRKDFAIRGFDTCGNDYKTAADEWQEAYETLPTKLQPLENATKITRFDETSKNGIDIAAEVSKVLEETVQSSGKITDLASEIAAASQEQAQGSDQVNTAIAQMDKITQQNAANAEESASASEELSSQAESMNDIVGDLAALVGGAAGHHTTGRVARTTTHLNANASSQIAGGRRATASPGRNETGQLAVSDHVFHKIAGRWAPVKSAHRAIPLGDKDEF